jgi:hypothetical protein
MPAVDWNAAGITVFVGQLLSVSFLNLLGEPRGYRKEI